jgi:hypothetical protein
MHTARPRAASVREMHPPSHPSPRPRARARPKPRRPAMHRRRPGSDGLWNNPF